MPSTSTATGHSRRPTLLRLDSATPSPVAGASPSSPGCPYSSIGWWNWAVARDRVSRSVIVALLDAGSTELLVAGSHMAHLTYGSPVQFRRLRRALEVATAGRPAVLAGDMNLWVTGQLAALGLAPDREGPDMALVASSQPGRSHLRQGAPALRSAEVMPDSGFGPSSRRPGSSFADPSREHPACGHEPGAVVHVERPTGIVEGLTDRVENQGKAIRRERPMIAMGRQHVQPLRSRVVRAPAVCPHLDAVERSGRCQSIPGALKRPSSMMPIAMIGDPGSVPSVGRRPRGPPSAVSGASPGSRRDRSSHPDRAPTLPCAPRGPGRPSATPDLTRRARTSAPLAATPRRSRPRRPPRCAGQAPPCGHRVRCREPRSLWPKRAG